ncbi:MAG: NADH-quinone oxidoreductase subunit M [Acidimicrobiales bacterium]
MNTLTLAAADASFPVLTSLIVVPIIGAIIIALSPSTRAEVPKLIATIVSVIAGGMSLWVLADFDIADAGYQLNESVTWVEGMGISWSLGIDGISLFLVVLTGFIFPLAILAVDPHHDAKPYYAWLLALEAGVMGVFLTKDLFFFFVFFEIVLVPMYFLIGKWGHENRKYAATKFFIYTMFGSALMLVGILATVFITASTTGNDVTFDLVTLAEGQALATTTARWIFLSFALAFAVKVPVFPLHTWLPDAHTEAPTAGSVILAGVMLKLGTYGFLRFGLYLFPEAAVYFAPLMITLGVIGIIYGAIAATMQKDLKRLVAYSSVAHLGFIVMGTFALNTEGIEGGLLQMVNHGISTGALFLLVGMIYERRHTRIISELGGLQKSAPIMAGIFTVVMLSSIGLPGLNGFPGEFLTLIGAFNAHRWWAVVAASGVIIAALYLLWAYQRVFHGPAEGENAEMADMNVGEILTMVPLLALIVFMGIYPKPVLERMEPAVEALVDHIEASVPGFSEPVGEIRTADDAESHSGDEHETEDGE